MHTALRAFIPFCIVSAFVVWLAISSRTSEPCPNGCNVLLIMVDTLSANHMDLYGYSRPTMPKTAAFFSKGIVFENAYSAAPWTYASFPSMYFSDLSSTISYQDIQGHTDRPTMQSALRDHGIKVRGALQYPGMFIFQEVDMPFRQDERLPMSPKFTEKTDITNELFADATAELHTLEQAPTGKFFMMVHTFQVHTTYDPVPPYDTYFGTTTVETVTMADTNKINQDIEEKKSDHAAERAPYALLYDQGLAQLDDMLSAFLDSLPKETLNNTVIILAADHGEAFGEHALFAHGNALYDEELHVPLAMYVPGVKPRRVTEPVSLLDMAPTILSLEKVPVPATFTGKSLVPLITGGTLGERILRFENGLPSFLVEAVKMKEKIKPDLKLEETGALNTASPLIEQDVVGVRSGSVVLFTKKGQDTPLLFDLAKDPKEKDDLYGSVPPALDATIATLKEALKQNTRR